MTKKPVYHIDVNGLSEPVNEEGSRLYKTFEEFNRDNWASDAYKVVIYCEDCGSTSKEGHEDKVFNNECKEHKN